MIWTPDKLKHYKAGRLLGYLFYPFQLWLLATQYDHLMTYFFVVFAALITVLISALKELYDLICLELLQLKQSDDFDKLPGWKQRAIIWISEHVNLNHTPELGDFKATMIGFWDGLKLKTEAKQ